MVRNTYPTAELIEPVHGRRRRDGPRSVVSNFAWATSGNVIYALSQWGLVVAATNLATTDTVGEFVFALSVSAPIFMLANLELRSILATDVGHEWAFSQFAVLRALLIAGAVVGSAGAALVLSPSAKIAAVVFLVATAKAFESLSDLFYGIFQREERLDIVAKSMMGRAALGLAGVSLALLVWPISISAATALSFAWGLVFLIHDLRRGRRILGSGPERVSFRLNRPQLASVRGLAALAFPLGLVMFLISLNVNVPRYFVAGSLSLSALGLFGPVSYILVGLYTIVFALGQSVAPRLARLFAHDRRSFMLTLIRVEVVALSIALLSVVIVQFYGRDILVAIYGDAYAPAEGVFKWLAYSFLPGSVGALQAFALTAIRSLRVQIPIYAAAVIVTVGTCLLLVPRHGLIGAGQAIFASTIVQMCGSTIALMLRVRGRGGR
jgi:O-antigen/teichoic acid export membrane protein